MSFYEIVVILLVALIVIKPERFPEIAYTFGRIIAKIRNYFLNAQNKITPWL